MYTQRQISQLQQEFWTAFGQYMSPIPNADGEKTNWVNYKTGNRFVKYKMEVSKGMASVSIVLCHPEPKNRNQYVQQFLLQRQFFETIVGKDWEWLHLEAESTDNETIMIRRIVTEVSIFNKECWPTLITFFKQSITAFDAFWQTAQYGYETLSHITDDS